MQRKEQDYQEHTNPNPPPANATNNGSYTWRGNSYDSALVYGFSYGSPSGCNYSIELKVWTDVVYSPYFTIINPEDGGLEPASQCPSGDSAALGPAAGTCTCLPICLSACDHGGKLRFCCFC